MESCSLNKTLSDHSLIEVTVKESAFARRGNIRDEKQFCFTRWSISNMNWDLLKAAIMLKDWLCPQPLRCDPKEAATKLNNLLMEACDVAASRKEVPK